MPENPDWVHPLDAMARREPLTRAAVRVVVMAVEDAARAEAIGDGLIKLLSQRGRKGSAVVVRPDVHGWNRALEHGLHGSDEPIVVVTSAVAPWAVGHLDPLLKAIDERDHAVGRRPRSVLARLGRRLAAWPYRFLFAVPVADVFSPLRIHRREALDRIPLQSASRLLDVEILAKATFFVQTVEEVAVPDLPSIPVGPVAGDLASLFSNPVLRVEDTEPTRGAGGLVDEIDPEPAPHPNPSPQGGEGPEGEALQSSPSPLAGEGRVGGSEADAPSRPAEPPQGQGEGHDGPGREDAERDHDVAVEEGRPFEHDPAQCVQELGEG